LVLLGIHESGTAHLEQALECLDEKPQIADSPDQLQVVNTLRGQAQTLLAHRKALTFPAPGSASPSPLPASSAPKSYLIFFGSGQPTITDRAKQVIKEAADNSMKLQYSKIEVNGYTDTTGTHQTSQALSERYAQAVAAELIKDGVRRNKIYIQGFGDTQLLVPTGPGVGEPQNRRVEVIIR
jgi:outer membrane protein OmpA-like peptidoglycan-associated protein